MLNISIFLFVVLGGLVPRAMAQTSLEIFQQVVHPILQQRCAECHGDDQFPLHSVDDINVAYKDGVQSINLNFPEESALWIRSFNNHCDKVDLCGKKDPALLAAMGKWIQKELEGRGPTTEGFDLVAETSVEIPKLGMDAEIKDGDIESLLALDNFSQTLDKIFEQRMSSMSSSDLKMANLKKADAPKARFITDTGLSVIFDMSRLSESYFYISNPQIENVKNYYGLEGFLLQTDEAFIQAQHFRESQAIFKNTEKPLGMTPKGSGYFLIKLVDKDASTLKFQLYVKGPQESLTRDQAKDLFDGGYFMPGVQTVVHPKLGSIVVGGNHSCATFENQQVRCWGYQEQGRLGQNFGENTVIGDASGELGPKTPIIDLGDESVVASIAIASAHTCARFDDQQLKCWGDGSNGHLGYGDSDSRGAKAGEMGKNLLYVDLGSLPVRETYLGGGFGCALYEAGPVACWGENFGGQLGYGDTNSRGDDFFEMGDSMPFVDFGNETVRSLALGANHGCALFESGKVRCWGAGESGELGGGEPARRGDQPNEMGESLPYVDLGEDEIQTLYAGLGNHTCALFVNGGVKCWGSGSRGQLGQGSMENIGDAPNELGKNLDYIKLGPDPIQSLALGSRYSCALFQNGKAKCWGDGSNGQLGHEARTSIGGEPNQMGENLDYINIGKHKIVKLSAGSGTTCAILDNGRGKCWGSGFDGKNASSTGEIVGTLPGSMGSALPFIDIGQELSFD